MKIFFCFTMGGLYGEFAKAIGRNIGGHWVPKEKSLANSFNKHGYNKKAAARGEAAGDFLSTTGSLANGIWEATSFIDDCVVENTTYHSLDKMGAAIVDRSTIYFTQNITWPIVKTALEGAAWSSMWSAAQEPQTFGSY